MSEQEHTINDHRGTRNQANWQSRRPTKPLPVSIHPPETIEFNQPPESAAGNGSLEPVGNPLNKMPAKKMTAKLLSRSCISPAPGFAFGTLIYDVDVVPGLNLLFPTFEVKLPVHLHLEADRSLTIGWADGSSTEVGCLHGAVVKAYRRHRQVDVAIGIRGSKTVLKFVLRISTRSRSSAPSAPTRPAVSR